MGYIAKISAVKVSVGDANGPTIARIVRRGDLIPEGVDEALLQSLAERGLIESVPDEEELLAALVEEDTLDQRRRAAEQEERDRVAAEEAAAAAAAAQTTETQTTDTPPADKPAPTKRTSRSS
jgi:hypothetical protein